MSACRAGHEAVEEMVGPTLLSEAELQEGLASLGLSAEGLEAVQGVLAPGGQVGEEAVEEWLTWARAHPDTVKVVEGKMPVGLLPEGLTASLHDVKVGGKKYGPDDALYNSSAELRDRIARGNTVLRMEDPRSGRVTLDMVIFALKKFTGGMGDEDEDQPEDAMVWQRYFLRPMEDVKRVVCVTKENGEAAHLAVRCIQGQFYYIAGSKNVHLMFRSKEELEQYTEPRYMVAKTVADAWLDTAAGLAPAALSLLCNLLHSGRLTLVMEILIPSYQHVVSLSHLSKPSLRFLTLTTQYSSQAGRSLTALPPDTCLQLGGALGLQCAQYTVISAGRAEARMEEVRAGYGYEGEVLYFMDADGCTVGLVKKKTAWYVVCRAIREKVNSATSQHRRESRAGGGAKQQDQLHLAKLDKRLGEIRAWLGLSPQQTLRWQQLGRGFLTWVMDQLRAAREPSRQEELCARGNFPQHWQQYLREAGLDDTGEGEVREEEVAAEGPQWCVREPREGGPVVRVEGGLAPRPHIATCIVRRLDLVGRNLKKLQGALHKSRQRAAKEPGLVCVGAHDLAKVEPVLLYTSGSPSVTHPGCEAPLTIQELRGRGLLQGGAAGDGAGDGAGPWSFLVQGRTVVAVPPLVSCRETQLTEETEDVFLEVTSAVSEEQADSGLRNLLKQIFHMGISLNSSNKKYIEVEKGAVLLPDGLRKTYPSYFEPL